MQWFYADQQRRLGPVEEADLDQLVNAGVIRGETLVWHEGMATWQPYESVRPGAGAAGASPDAPSDTAARFCAECGRPYTANELVSVGGSLVCATCKPIALQRLRETGETPVHRHYAGFWIRFVARIIDAIVTTLASWVIQIPLAAVMGGAGSMPGSAAIAANLAFVVVSTLLGMAIAISYETYFLTSRGATPGKMVLGLQVIMADGGKLTVGTAIGRYFAQFISAFTLAIGYIMAGLDDQKRALHDRICGTRVIYTK